MSLPDFMTNPNAVLEDKDHEWRYNRIPDYTKVNATYEEGLLFWIDLVPGHKLNHVYIQKRHRLMKKVLLNGSFPTWSR